MHGAARTVRTVGAVLATVLLGALVGVLGAFRHPSDWTVGGVAVPVGALAGVAALLLAQFAARRALPKRLGPAVVLLSWTVVVVVLGGSRPEGDLVVPAGLHGEGFLYGGFLAGLCASVGFALRGASGGPSAGR